jgi:hypothetical protein
LLELEPAHVAPVEVGAGPFWVEHCEAGAVTDMRLGAVCVDVEVAGGRGRVEGEDEENGVGRRREGQRRGRGGANART